MEEVIIVFNTLITFGTCCLNKVEFFKISPGAIDKELLTTSLVDGGATKLGGIVRVVSDYDTARNYTRPGFFIKSSSVVYYVLSRQRIIVN